MRKVLGWILTWDVAIHLGAAVPLTFLIGPAGTMAVFLVREMEQAADDGNRWRPWRWGGHSHAEWVVPTLATWAVATLPLAW